MSGEEFGGCVCDSVHYNNNRDCRFGWEYAAQLLWRQIVLGTVTRGADVDIFCRHFLWLNAGNRSIIVQWGWLQVVYCMWEHSVHFFYAFWSPLCPPPLNSFISLPQSLALINTIQSLFLFVLVPPRWQSLSCQQPLLHPSICSISLVASTYRYRQRKKPWGSEKVSALSETRRNSLCFWTANSRQRTKTWATEFRPLGTLHLLHSTGLC